MTRAYMRDAQGRRLDDFVARRDLPATVLHLDASTLSGTDNSRVPVWPDLSGALRSQINPTVATQPTLKTAIQNGLNIVRAGAASFLARATFGNGWGEAAGYAQPLSITVLVKVASGARSAVSAITGWSSPASTNRLSLQLDINGTPQVFGGAAAGAKGGASLNDDTWHAVTGVFDVGSSSLYVDGYLVGTIATQAHGTNVLVGMGIGSDAGGTSALGVADWAEVIVNASRLSPALISELHSILHAKWGTGATVGPQKKAVVYTDATDSAAQPIRYWQPDGTGAVPLVIWSHPHAQTEAIAPGYFAYQLAHACLQEGWGFIATRQHSNSWGNASAVTDLLNAYTYFTGIRSVSKVILAGASMGGLPTLTAYATAAVPNIAGALLIDGVTDLQNMYSNATYTSSVQAAYGVATYAEIPADRNPIARAASAYSGKRFRLYTSPNDTAVPRAAHADAFKTLVNAGAAESGVVTHLGAHLESAGTRPADAVAFIKRCLAA